MKRILRKTLIIAIAVACAFSVHITVNAQSGVGGNTGLGNSIFGDLIDQIINGLKPDNTTAENPDNSSTTDPNVTTDPNAATTDPVNNSGTGTVPSSTESTVNYPPANTTLNNNNYTTAPQLTTTEPAGDEEMSFTYDSSLSGLLEADSAAIIVQPPAEPYTIGGLVVNNGGNDKDVFSWQKIALIAAAGLFMILAALVAALLIQRSKKDDDKDTGVRTDSVSDAPTEPVAVEVMTAERIAELLGTAPGRSNSAHSEGYSSADSAAAIKTAALMGQLNSYSDPLIRKYTEEPVRISPLANVGADGDVTAAEILEATDSLLEDITGNEKFAADTSGMSFSTDSIENMLEDTEIKICPECQSPVKSGDVFCHSCGSYVG